MPPPVSLSPRPCATGQPKMTRSASRHSSAIGAEPVTMNLMRSKPNFARTFSKTSRSYSGWSRRFVSSSRRFYVSQRRHSHLRLERARKERRGDAAGGARLREDAVGDAVEEARDGGENGGSEVDEVVEDLGGVSLGEADARAVEDHGHLHEVLEHMCHRQVADMCVVVVQAAQRVDVLHHRRAHGHHVLVRQQRALRNARGPRRVADHAQVRGRHRRERDFRQRTTLLHQRVEAEETQRVRVGGDEVGSHRTVLLVSEAKRYDDQVRDRGEVGGVRGDRTQQQQRRRGRADDSLQLRLTDDRSRRETRRTTTPAPPDPACRTEEPPCR